MKRFERIVSIPPERQPLIDAYQEGKSLNEVAALFECSPASVVYWLKRAGVARRPRGITNRIYAEMYPEAAARRAEIVAKLDAGATLEDVAAEYGVTRQRISQIMHRAGIWRPQGAGRSVSKLVAEARAASAEQRAFLNGVIAEERAERERRLAGRIAHARAMRAKGAAWMLIEREVGIQWATVIKHAPELRERKFSPRRKWSQQRRRASAFQHAATALLEAGHDQD